LSVGEQVAEGFDVGFGYVALRVWGCSHGGFIGVGISNEINVEGVCITLGLNNHMYVTMVDVVQLMNSTPTPSVRSDQAS
jgi:hypothetical protein